MTWHAKWNNNKNHESLSGELSNEYQEGPCIITPCKRIFRNNSNWSKKMG